MSNHLWGKYELKREITGYKWEGNSPTYNDRRYVFDAYTIGDKPTDLYKDGKVVLGKDVKIGEYYKISDSNVYIVVFIINENPGPYDEPYIEGTSFYGPPHKVPIYGKVIGKGSYVEVVKSASRNTYPDDGEQNGYWYVYRGVDNQSPTISGKDEDFGGQKEPFKKYFSVDDPDVGQTLKVTVKLNGATIQTIDNATRGQDYEVDINKERFESLELNRTNTIEISVSDGSGATAIRRWTFSRSNSIPKVEVTTKDMGEQNEPFSFSFTPSDDDGDKLTCKIYLDDVQIQDVGEVMIGEEKTISLGRMDYSKLLNGDHRIRIEVTDIHGAKGYGYVDFSKNVTNGWYKYKKETEKQATNINVMTMIDLAEGAKVSIKVCNNAFDESPTWEELKEEQLGNYYKFTNTTKTAEKWGVGVWVQVDRDKAIKNSYIYGFVGSWQ